MNSILPPYKYDPDFDVESIPRKWHYRHQREPLIDPHGDRIVDMIKAGKKGLAILHPKDDEFKNLQDYINSKQLYVLNISDPYPYGNVIVYRPELEDDAIKMSQYLLKNFEDIKNDTNLPIQEVIKQHQDMGKILGYPQKHIDYFCNKSFGNKISNIRENNINSIKNENDTYYFKNI